MVESHLIKCNEYLFQRAKTFGWWPHCNLSTNCSFLQRKTTLWNVKQSNSNNQLPTIIWIPKSPHVTHEPLFYFHL
jgi:hypothetical protein